MMGIPRNSVIVSSRMPRHQPPLFHTRDPRHRILFLRRVHHIRCSRCVRALPNTAVWQNPRLLAALEPPHGDPPVSEPSFSKGQRHFCLVIAGISMSFPRVNVPEPRLESLVTDADLGLVVLLEHNIYTFDSTSSHWTKRL
jgi:hypothetical protein